MPSSTSAALGTATFAGLPGHFCLFYQPLLDLRDGRICSCEALLRWQHPDFGILRPGAALGGSRWEANLAEIERWAIREVCRQGRAWSDDGIAVEVAVNVSRARLLDPDLAQLVDAALADADLAPRLLAIDAPFASLTADPTGFRPILAELVHRGVSVAADGVGSGVSLASLGCLPTSAWKIDLRRGRRRDRGLHPSVHAALDAGSAAGVITVAKAVETSSLLAEVRAMGFDRAFGHAVSPPVTPAAAGLILGRGLARPGVRVEGGWTRRSGGIEPSRPRLLRNDIPGRPQAGR